MTCDTLLLEYPWISPDLFETALKHTLLKDQSIVVRDFRVELALKPGENYGSQILRAHIKYVCSNDGETSERSLENDRSNFKTVSVIIKASLGSRVTRSVNVFEKEIFMFENVIPRLEKLLKDAEIETRMAPM